MKFFKLENNDELQANLFSFAVHLALFLVMIFSVGWQTKIPYYGEVEIWDSVPVQKKINKTQTTSKKKIKQHLDNSLMLVTALAPHIGYDKAAKIAKTALKNGTTLRYETLKTGLVKEKDYEQIVDPRKMIYPS